MVDGLIVAAREGSSSVLVVRGEPGIGKTALLNHSTGLAVGCTVIRVVGLESEFDVPFAALHRVVLPLRHGIAGLPAALRRCAG